MKSQTAQNTKASFAQNAHKSALLLERPIHWVAGNDYPGLDAGLGYVLANGGRKHWVLRTGPTKAILIKEAAFKGYFDARFDALFARHFPATPRPARL